MIHIARSAGVVCVTLDRPAQRNALTPDMLGALEGVFESPEPEDRAVVLLGAGRVFCAGFDLSLCRTSPDGAVMGQLLTGLSRAIRAMVRCPLPIVLGVQGAAIAGGCALLGGADVVIADQDAKLGYPVVKLGVSPAVSAPTLSDQVSGGDMRQLLLEPELIDAKRASAMGLVHELVADREAVLPRAHEVAQSLASKPSGGIEATKALLLELAQHDAGDAMSRALEVSLGLVGGAEERSMLESAWGGR